MNTNRNKNNFSFQKDSHNTSSRILNTAFNDYELFYLDSFKFRVSINEKLQIIFANIRV
jgi:hypothetical protein